MEHGIFPELLKAFQNLMEDETSIAEQDRADAQHHSREKKKNKKRKRPAMKTLRSSYVWGYLYSDRHTVLDPDGWEGVDEVLPRANKVIDKATGEER